MKVSDFIVEYLIEKKITDVFGYPGGMVTHLMDSFGKYENKINTHITYHEQGAAFAACGYAQASGKTGVAFATSGPGATNLLTGICNAYFDSIPTVFITGQVNTFESKGDLNIRQKGFQETDIISMVSGVTKAAIYVSKPEDIKSVLDQAFYVAQEGRKGPVVLDIPMNIFRADIENINLEISRNEFNNKSNSCEKFANNEKQRFREYIKKALLKSKRPCLLVGNGVRQANQINEIREVVKKAGMPVVSSMLAVDIIPEEAGLEGTYYGFVGAYGNRTANFVVAKCDLIICLGTRLDVRQVGAKRENFAPQADIIRVDIDSNELQNKIREEENQFLLTVNDAVTIFREVLNDFKNNDEWLSVCKEIKKKVKAIDEKHPNRVINSLSKNISDGYSIVADVGQNMVWVAQSFKMKENQRLYMSGGHGAMGYALPAAIGIYYATHKPVVCISGDGGFQMNIQELQFIARERLPIKMVVLNNISLGMIRHFQEMYFDSNYNYTVSDKGYTVPDFCKIVEAYGVGSKRIEAAKEIDEIDWTSNNPEFYEIMLEPNTVVFPKLEFGKPNQDQEPLLDRELYQYLMSI